MADRKRCPYTGKLAHRKRKLAVRHADRLRRLSPAGLRKGLKVYRCRMCCAWHVGHHDPARVGYVPAVAFAEHLGVPSGA